MSPQDTPVFAPSVDPWDVCLKELTNETMFSETNSDCHPNDSPDTECRPDTARRPEVRPSFFSCFLLANPKQQSERRVKETEKAVGQLPALWAVRVNRTG